MPFEFDKDNRTSEKSDSLSSFHKTSEPQKSFSGFTDMPTLLDDENTRHLKTTFDRGATFSQSESLFHGRRFSSKPAAGRGRSFSLTDVPWGLLLIAVLVVGSLYLLYVYQDVITAFLTKIIAWIIIITLGYVLLRWIIFGR